MTAPGDGAGAEADRRAGTGSSAPQPPSRARRRAAATASLLALLVVAVVPAYFVLLAFTTEPAGPWDHDKVTFSAYMGWIALVATGVLALLTLVVTRAGWLRRWWYALPLLLGLAALARLTVLAPQV